VKSHLIALAAVASVAGTAALGTVLGACSGQPSAASDGPAVFQSWCATCHGPDGRPPPAMAVRLGVRDLTAPEFRARVVRSGPGVVEQQVRSGSQNKLMPAFAGALSDAQIRAVAAFVASPQFVSPR
jgi:mono/diheme cytochrome c family protein